MKKLLKELKNKWYQVGPYGLNDESVLTFTDCSNLKEDLVDIVYYNAHPFNQNFVLIEFDETRSVKYYFIYWKRWHPDNDQNYRFIGK
jgi:hypothetical protein